MLFRSQIKLVSSFDWIDFSKLEGAWDIIREVFADPRAQELIGEDRQEAIVQMVKHHIETLHALAERHTQQEDHVSNDLKEDIAEDYSK